MHETQNSPKYQYSSEHEPHTLPETMDWEPPDVSLYPTKIVKTTSIHVAFYDLLSSYTHTTRISLMAACLKLILHILVVLMCHCPHFCYIFLLSIDLPHYLHQSLPFIMTLLYLMCNQYIPTMATPLILLMVLHCSLTTALL